MKRIFKTSVFTKAIWMLVLSICILYSCSQPEDVTPNSNNGQPNMNNVPGDDAPNFELTALDGSKFKMSNQNDKVVVLFFFGNTCPSCKAVGPDIEKKLKEAFNGKFSFVIIGLDVWDGNSSSLESFKNNTGISFPLLLNASSVGSSYGTTYDRLIVVDKNGKIAHKGSRSASNDLSTVVSTVTDLLSM